MRTHKKRVALFALVSPLLAVGFLLDVVIFLFTSTKACTNCGIKEIIEQGVFVRVINSYVNVL